MRYSTGAPVLAGDIRRGIERSLMHPDSTPAFYYQEIEGAKTCTDAARAAAAATSRARTATSARSL